MKPIRTPESNITYNSLEKDVEPLPALRIVADGLRVIVSTWKLNDMERAQLAQGGVLELSVSGEPPPPVALAVAAPLHRCAARMVWSVELQTWVCPDCPAEEPIPGQLSVEDVIALGETE